MESDKFLSKVVGHSQQKAYLRQLLADNRLPNALLFSGIEAIGKFLLAREFAKYILCREKDEANPCHVCFSCKQADAQTHPDLYVIDNEKEIKIEDIRSDLAEFLSKKPLYGNRKIVIINNADYMNDTSANALLKNLEEPPVDCLFILVSSHTDRLLPTIISRCNVLRFNPLAFDQISKIDPSLPESLEGNLMHPIDKKVVKAANAFFAGEQKIFSRQSIKEEYLGVGLAIREMMLLSLNIENIGYNVLENPRKMRISWDFWDLMDMYFDAQGMLDSVNTEILRFALQMKARQLYD